MPTSLNSQCKRERFRGPRGLTGRGSKGDPFIFDDFTPEQLLSIKGEKGDPGDSGSAAETFETISKNLKSYPYTIAYNGDDISMITYDTGGSYVFKSFAYTLFGAIWYIILESDSYEIRKDFEYTGEILTSVTYS